MVRWILVVRGLRVSSSSWELFVMCGYAKHVLWDFRFCSFTSKVYGLCDCSSISDSASHPSARHCQPRQIFPRGNKLTVHRPRLGVLVPQFHGMVTKPRDGIACGMTLKVGTDLQRNYPACRYNRGE